MGGVAMPEEHRFAPNDTGHDPDYAVGDYVENNHFGGDVSYEVLALERSPEYASGWKVTLDNGGVPSWSYGTYADAGLYRKITSPARLFSIMISDFNRYRRGPK